MSSHRYIDRYEEWVAALEAEDQRQLDLLAEAEQRLGITASATQTGTTTSKEFPTRDADNNLVQSRVKVDYSLDGNQLLKQSMTFYEGLAPGKTVADTGFDLSDTVNFAGKDLLPSASKNAAGVWTAASQASPYIKEAVSAQNSGKASILDNVELQAANAVSSATGIALPSLLGISTPDPEPPTAESESEESASPQKPSKPNTKNYLNPGGGDTPWQYPEKMSLASQDHVIFTAFRYSPRDYTNVTKENTFSSGDRKKTEVMGRCILPIQGGIQDLNTADWTNGSINPLQTLGVKAVINIADKDVQSTATSTFGQAEFGEVFSTATDDKMRKYLIQWAAGKAVGINNLSSRLTGTIINNNLELLFNGPQLRPFSFTYSLSPRSKEEAKQVKGIIGFFKRAMAVQKQDLFLKAPHVFEIKYKAAGEDHNSIGKIKTCALTSLNTQYTPAGTYSTYDDQEKTMTRYEIQLQFTEIDPVYSEDYEEDGYGTSKIGY